MTFIKKVIKYIISIILLSLYKKISSRTDINLNRSISSLTPSFVEISISTKSNNAFFQMKSPTSNENNQFLYKIEYQLEMSQVNFSLFNSNTTFYKNWEFTERQVLNQLQLLNSSYWNDYKVVYKGNIRYVNISNLESRSIYRVRYRYYNQQYGYSKYSDMKFVFTKKSDLGSENILLYAKGTGRGRHENSEIRIGNNLIMRNGNYSGLALAIFDRKTMKLDEVIEYNTMVRQADTVKKVSIVDFSLYDLSLSGTSNNINNYNTILKSITVKNTYKEVEALVKKLKSIENNKIIVIVSCHGWERYINNELLDILSSFGGLNVLEFKNVFEKDIKTNQNLKWSHKKLIDSNFYHHPMVFIGIKGLYKGMAYESIRSNKANYLSVKNIPIAELKVKLRFDYYFNNYYFDKDVLIKDKVQVDSYDLLWNSVDYSLSNLLPLLSYSNMTKGFNLGFDIYNNNTRKDVIYSKKIKFITEYDKVVLGEASKRFTYNGKIYQEGKDLSQTPYFKYFRSVFLLKKSCVPPYNLTINDECPSSSILDSNIDILKCQIGISPFLCKENVRIINNFEGFR